MTCVVGYKVIVGGKAFAGTLKTIETGPARTPVKRTGEVIAVAEMVHIVVVEAPADTVSA